MDRLKQYLVENELTQSDFAKRMSVSQPTVWGWLNGAMPSTEKLKELADVIGVSTDELLGRRSLRRTELRV